MFYMIKIDHCFEHFDKSPCEWRRRESTRRPHRWTMHGPKVVRTIFLVIHQETFSQVAVDRTRQLFHTTPHIRHEFGNRISKIHISNTLMDSDWISL